MSKIPKYNSGIIKDNFYKIVINNSNLIIRLIKIYPDIRKFLLNILDIKEFRFLSVELEIYNL